MSSNFVIHYRVRRPGRVIFRTGHYLGFEYNPQGNRYRAIVRPTMALGQQSVSLPDILNIQEFADWLAQRTSLRRQDPRPTSEITLPGGGACELAGISPRTYTDDTLHPSSYDGL